MKAILQVAAQYRPLPGFPKHQVGSDGTVWTCTQYGPKNGARRGKWRLLKIHYDQDGYARVCLGTPVAVHKCVLLAFVGPCPPGMQACHEDGDPANCALLNLRWDTPSNNNLDKRRHGTAQVGTKNGNHKLSDEQVRQIRSRKGGPYGTLSKTAREFGISRDWVNAIWDGWARKEPR